MSYLLLLSIYFHFWLIWFFFLLWINCLSHLLLWYRSLLLHGLTQSLSDGDLEVILSFKFLPTIIRHWNMRPERVYLVIKSVWFNTSDIFLSSGFVWFLILLAFGSFESGEKWGNPWWGKWPDNCMLRRIPNPFEQCDNFIHGFPSFAPHPNAPFACVGVWV